MSFASGKIALAICDKCGFECPYLELRETVVDSSLTGIKVCNDCWDPDHPQNKVGDLIIDDKIALEDPRPDVPRSDYTDLVTTPALSTLFIGQ